MPAKIAIVDTNANYLAQQIRDQKAGDVAALAVLDDGIVLADVRHLEVVGIEAPVGYRRFEGEPVGVARAENDLAGADAIAPGGFLVYTGQPWHPQLELIARTAVSHVEAEAKKVPSRSSQTRVGLKSRPETAYSTTRRLFDPARIVRSATRSTRASR